MAMTSIKKCQYSKEMVQAALDDVQKNSMTIRGSARLHGVPEATLRRRLKNPKGADVTMGGPTIFTVSEETKIAQQCIEMTNKGYTYTRGQILEIAAKMPKAIEKNVKPTKHWFYSFLKRHPQVETIHQKRVYTISAPGRTSTEKRKRQEGETSNGTQKVVKTETTPEKAIHKRQHSINEDHITYEMDEAPEEIATEWKVVDEFCNPDKPIKVQFQDVSAAAYKIKEGIQRTPCTKSRLSRELGMDVYFKKEFLQYTGSFKERGARYSLMMLSEKQKKVGVIAASAGNHALALCYHGHDLGIPVTVVMPLIAPLMKVQNCKTYGAEVIIHGKSLFESREYALKLGHERGLMYINGYDHPHIIAGQGTMGLEILEQVPDLDACIIPVGGGGLIAGTALAIKSLKPNVQVIGVEAASCPSFAAALAAGKAIYTDSRSTLADGLAVPVVGVNALETAKDYVDKMIQVKEESIALAILRLVELEKAVVEGAGAVGLAAIIEHILPELANKKVVIPLCGGNIDTTILGRSIERGLAVDGRLVRFVVTVSDRPGGIAELARLLASLGGSIKDIFHERAWLKSDVFSVQVKVVAETRDKEHADEIHEALKANYEQVTWGPVHF